MHSVVVVRGKTKTLARLVAQRAEVANEYRGMVRARGD